MIDVTLVCFRQCACEGARPTVGGSAAALTVPSTRLVLSGSARAPVVTARPVGDLR